MASPAPAKSWLGRSAGFLTERLFVSPARAFATGATKGADFLGHLFGVGTQSDDPGATQLRTSAAAPEKPKGTLDTLSDILRRATTLIVLGAVLYIGVTIWKVVRD